MTGGTTAGSDRAPRKSCAVEAAQLPIAGLTPLSLCDWPGRLVATVFVQGCPWRCTYCHNPGILDMRTPGAVPWREVTGLLDRRRGRLDGVVFSGGEATGQPALPAAVREVKDAGFAVGLHTAGAYPRRLAEVLPYVDWVGLDIKATRASYPTVTGVRASADKAFASLDLILAAGVEVQVRTTVDPTVMRPADVGLLTAQLRNLGVRDHVLQQVRATGTTQAYQRSLAAMPDAEAIHDAALVAAGLQR